MSKFTVLTQNDGLDIDNEVRNAFKWEWMSKIDANGQLFEKWLRKINVKGAAMCIACNKTIMYGSTGLSDIKKHSM